ncbi:MAG: PAS domain-containing sensor histidine kinase, partial [Candidatus Aminicenantes bacterium]|nr:PAS domain-containing sensor histidine kinase [Candidatus Aminicenantes bacterium]NIM78780.1 PAS domain-containing sensor histidine kinase [Candidatus Aminicenantes bacterium]NIN18035.1 PAS domain-containing sensor histidine kinase [Candidatus Aminicenantes bacterium]NIN41935.1 PAS domain-containing sensor histidine kinase [Candidatus Aminicenantes bacterium]NIN84690.1 PAS domain-containing sensor histidine kinase [Candidatus Aminicenantes bacterium]
DFYRVDEISGITGLGIGLSIARDYVEENGGKLNFESKHGKGSKFWFELPISHKKRKEVQNDV